jgi:hypothetical protein
LYDKGYQELCIALYGGGDVTSSIKSIICQGLQLQRAEIDIGSKYTLDALLDEMGFVVTR